MRTHRPQPRPGRSRTQHTRRSFALRQCAVDEAQMRASTSSTLPPERAGYADALLTPVRRRLPSTTPDTADSGETEQQRLDRLYPVGPDTRVDGRYLYTILRSGRQPTEDEWRGRLARRPRRRSPRRAWSHPSPHTSPRPPTRPSSRSLPSLLFRRRKRPARRRSSSNSPRIAGGLDHPPTLRRVASMPHR